MKWIGLTGGIATGKSAAKKLIESLGVPVIDADELARFVVQPDQPGYRQVVSHFGADVVNPDQSLNRSKLAEIIFTSQQQRQELEGILHPLIQIQVQILKKKFADEGHTLCFYDVPLLFEKKMQDKFACTVLIWCDEPTQKSRLITRNHLTEKQVHDRIQAQWPLFEKLPLATYCVDNSSTFHSLEVQIKNLISKLQAKR